MISNYLKTGWRNFLRNKGFTFINITGLAMGLACFILIALYVTDELSYDKFNEKAGRIYRVDSDIRFGGNDLHLAVNSGPMGATLKKDYPQVEEFTRIYGFGNGKLVKKDDEYINELNSAHVDSTFFDVFTLPAVSGNTKNALNEPNTVVITESTARKYFGTREAVGQTIEADKTPYKVTAVIRDIPKNAHFNFDFLFSMDNADYGAFESFLSHNLQTYIVLQEGTDYKKFEKNFDQVLQKYIVPQAKQFMQINSMEDFKKAGNKLEYSLTPVTDIHLRSDRIAELGPNGNIQYVYIFGAVAIFVLLIACINFMNLSTARSAKRAKEVGVRKVLGTEKGSLIAQFLFESIIMVTISLIFALGLAILVLPYFNTIAAKQLSIFSLFNAYVLPFLIILPLVVGLVAGSYPAFFLSRFKPIDVLKGNTRTGFKRSTLRNSLVVFQFTTSIILIIGTIIVYKQLNYIQTKNLGFNKDQVLIVKGTGALEQNAKAFKNEILNFPGVKSGTLSGYLPIAASSRNDNSFSKEAVMDVRNGFNMQTWTIDHDYIKTFGMEIIKGRDFSKDFPSDSTAIIINETTAKLLGYENPLGQKIYTMDEDPSKRIAYHIIGVVKNFNFNSLRENIGPLSFFLGSSEWRASFKVDTKNIASLIKEVEKTWKKLAPGMPFSYEFLDQGFDNMYRAEQRIGKIAITFAILSILIACLGLFGLATFMAEQRTKEIGIRKVLGASVGNVVTMLSADFLKLVAISFCLAVPLAWWAMHNWLQDFAYRVDIGWWVFVLAGWIALMIALVTVSFRAITAALANPVLSLRSE
ncbi:ABC transporter permease [Flavitalea antarctica]